MSFQKIKNFETKNFLKNRKFSKMPKKKQKDKNYGTMKKEKPKKEDVGKNMPTHVYGNLANFRCTLEFFRCCY